MAVTSSETTNSVFNITDENKSFSITTPGYWCSRGGAGTIQKIQLLAELRSQNDVDLHVEELGKRVNQVKTGEREYKLLDLDTHKNKIYEELKNAEYNNLEDMVFRMELTYFEIGIIPPVKYFHAKSTGDTFTPGIYEIIDNKLMLMSLLSDDLEITFTIDDNRIRKQT